METISRGEWPCGREVSTPSGYVPRSCGFRCSVAFRHAPGPVARRCRVASPRLAAPALGGGQRVGHRQRRVGPATRRAVIHAGDPCRCVTPTKRNGTREDRGQMSTGPATPSIPDAHLSPALATRVSRALALATRHSLSTQRDNGSWLATPDPRITETALCTLALAHAPHPGADRAAERGRAWLADGAAPQNHHPVAHAMEAALLSLALDTGGPIDVSHPSFADRALLGPRPAPPGHRPVHRPSDQWRHRSRRAAHPAGHRGRSPGAAQALDPGGTLVRTRTGGDPLRRPDIRPASRP